MCFIILWQAITSSLVDSLSSSPIGTHLEYCVQIFFRLYYGKED